jgi:hypothetical protein
MRITKPSFRRPDAHEQPLLDELSVRLVHPDEQPRFDALLIEHHYLHSAAVVGEQWRYVATFHGQWLGLALWGAPALHLRARDAAIGCNDQQRRTRLGLIANNTPLLVLPQCHYPNLISGFMKLMLARLSAECQQRWAHPLAMVESFVDPQLFQGTAYKVSGCSKLGATAGWARTGQGQDDYVAPGAGDLDRRRWQEAASRAGSRTGQRDRRAQPTLAGQPMHPGQEQRNPRRARTARAAGSGG